MKRMVNVLFAGVLAMTVLSCGEEKKGYTLNGEISDVKDGMVYLKKYQDKSFIACLLYTSPSPRDRSLSRMPSSA